jgi:SAM-dependent methyltransferase
VNVREVVQRAWDRPGAERYERVRPDYPQSAIDHIAQSFGIDESSELLDLAAGTGKLTRALLATGARVTAVEPLEGMRDVLVRELPDVEVLAGTAEEIPLADGSLDLVLVGQAFHWFDPVEAPREIARVLRPRGGLAAIWNVRNESTGWTDQVREVLERHKGDTPRHSDDKWRAGIASSGLYARIELRLFDHVQELPREDAIQTYGSRSYVSALPEDQRARVLEEVAEILPDQPTVAIPYTTQVYWTRRSP